MSVRWDGQHWATESTSPADWQRSSFARSAPCEHATIRCDDATHGMRRGHGELRSAGNYLTVDPPRYLASRPGGGAYEAAAAALASTPGGGGSAVRVGEAPNLAPSARLELFSVLA